MSKVITVRVGKEMREKIRKHRIPISETVRRALESEIRKRERQERAEDLEILQRILKKIPDQRWVRAIRESRDNR